PATITLPASTRTASRAHTSTATCEFKMKRSQRGRRYGRPVRLGKNPTKPTTRILATGNDAVRLLEHLYQHGAGRTSGPRVQALRQIMVQNYHRDQAGPALAHRREGGRTRAAALVPGSRLALRHLGPLRTARTHHQPEGVRRSSDPDLGPDGPNVITDVATTAATTHDSQVLPGIRPTAFQHYLDQREIPRLKSWRTLGT
ncbi:hypothetical protein OOZ58_45300, partial [Streptomyces tauricus]|nr:hypothetical protein [Streptomyces tauricus]